MKKIVLITGATSGIGEACARKFAQNGDKVILTGRNQVRMTAIADELKAQGAEVLTLMFDVRDREAARQAIESLPAEWQEIDVLVNNAGLALGLEPEFEGNSDDWDGMIDTNVKGLLTMTRLIVPGMVARDRGHVINMGSVAGDAAYAGERAANVYKGIKPLTGDDIADVAVYAANAPAHVQIAEVLILATHQASGSVIVRK